MARRAADFLDAEGFLDDGGEPSGSAADFLDAAAFLDEPVAAPAAEDSWTSLGRRLIENAPSMFRASAGGMTEMLARSGPSAGAPPWMMPGDPQWEAGTREFQSLVDEAGAAGKLPGRQMYLDAAQDLRDNAPNVDSESLKGYAYDITQSVIQMVPALATSILTRSTAPGATIIGGQVMGQRYGESLEAGRSHEQASADAAFYGLAEGIPETIPLGVLIKPGKRFLPRLFKAGAAEGIQEVFTEALQSGYNAGVLDEEMTWGEALNNLKRAGIIGFGAGSGLAAVSHPFTRGQPDVPQPEPDVESDAVSADEVTSFVDDRLRELDGKDRLTPTEHSERTFLRDNRSKPEVIAEAYNVQLQPMGAREQARTEAPPLTDDDVTSPIPTELIQQGRETLQDAVGSVDAAKVLQEAGFPAINSEVTVRTRDGGEANGTVVDAFDDGTRRGAKVRFDDGRVVAETFDAWRNRVISRQEDDDAGQIPEDRDQAQGPVEGAEARQETRPQAAAPGRIAERPELLTADLVDEADPIERTRANIAGQPPERASLIVLRDMIEDGTDVMNDGQFPQGVREAAGRLSGRIDAALASGEDMGPIHAEAADAVREWLKDHEFDPAEATELRAIQKTIEEQAALPSPAGSRLPVESTDAGIRDVGLRGIEGGAAPRAGVAAGRTAVGGVAPGRRGTVAARPAPGRADDFLDLGETADTGQALNPEIRGFMARAADAANAFEAGNTRPFEQLRLEALEQSDEHIEVMRRALDDVGVNPDRYFDRTPYSVKRRTLSADERDSAVEGEVVRTGASAATLRGERVDNEWVRFPTETGTLAIPRNSMPQIKAEHRGALANFLKARGIVGTEETVPATSLKPTRAEFSEKKVAKAKGFEGGDRAILVSSDGHVLDGHHQWIKDVDQGNETRIIRLDAPIRQLLHEVREFPSVEGGTPVLTSSASVEGEKISTPGAEARQKPAAARPVAESQASTPAVRERLFVEFAGRRAEVESFEDASAKWDEFRERTGAGARDLPPTRIVDEQGKKVADIAYNGRIFPVEPAAIEPGPEAPYEIDETGPADYRKRRLKDKAFRDLTKALNQPEPTSPSAMNALQGWLDAGAGRDLDATKELSTEGMQRGGFNPVDSYRSAYVSYMLGEPTVLRALDKTPAKTVGPPPARDSRPPPSPQDLFGDDTRAAQALADETRRRDEARQRGQDSVETGDASDLFSQARDQVDIEDVAAIRVNDRVTKRDGDRGTVKRIFRVDGRERAEVAFDEAKDGAVLAERYDQNVDLDKLTKVEAEPSQSVTAASAPESPQERRGAAEPQPSVPAAEREAGAASGDRIEDFGETLEGARKHAWAAYRDRLREAGEVDIAAAPLSKSWPQPEYQKLLDDGADPWVVAFIRAARDEIPTKPTKPWRRKEWVKQVEALRNFSEQALDGRIPPERIREGLDAHPVFKAFSDRIELYAAVGHAKSLKGVRISAGQYSMLNGEKIDPPRTIWTIERAAKATAFSNWPTQLAQGDTREAAIAAFTRNYSSIDTQPRASKQVKFDIYSYRAGPKVGKWIVGKKVGKDRVDFEEFDTVKEARAYRADHNDELVKALERWKNIPEHRKESDAPRVGADHRNGADIAPETFSETFGFRGVQFGNYVEGGRRQQDLNRAYDALLDLSGILGVPPKALSLNGELGLAFGARGKGGKRAARAHYEPDTVVINLTKREGAGSLAHEWWHALDNYFSRRRGGRLDYVSEDARERGDGIRPEVVEAFGELVRSISQTSLRERSRGLDRRRTKPYWSTGREMSARAFESYIVARLQDQEQSNDYLANIVSEDYWRAAAALGVGEGTEAQPDYPYPTAAEIPVIRAGFDQLFDVIETRETDQGVEMFSLVEPAQPGAGPLRSRMRFSEEWREKRGEVAADLRRTLDEIGLRRVTLRLPDSMDVIDGRQQRVGFISGRYVPNLIDISLSPERDYGTTLRHEAIHALRDLGLFRQAEWQTLEAAALSDADSMAEVRQRYAPQNLTDEQLVEERIADMYGEWHAGRSEQRGFLRTAFERIRNFLDALRKALHGHGFRSAADVFEAVERGEVRRDGEVVSATERFALRAGDFDPQRAFGQFDPERAAAAKRARATAPPPHDVQSNRFMDEAIFRFQDKFNYLYKAQKSAARARGLDQVPEAEDAYLAELRYHGMAGAAIEDFQRDHVDPLVEAISKSKLALEDVDTYLHARHAPEANAQLKRINPERPDNEALSGMSDEQAARVIDGFRRDGKLADLEKIAAQVDAITKAQREVMVAAGLESADTIAKWEETYQHYVPLHREGFDGRSPSRGKGFSVTGRQKRRAGSNRDVVHIVAQVVAQHEATIVRAEKNKVARALFEFARNNPNPDLYEVDKVEFQPSFGVDGLVTYRPQRGFQFAENTLVVKVDGNDHTITFNDRNHQAQRIAHAIKNLGADHSGPILNVLMRVTRFLALVNTGANPEFIISNFTRDIQTAGYNLSSTEADKLKWKIIKDVGKAWRGIRRFQKQKPHLWAEHFAAFRKAGAQTGWLDLYRDVAQREDRLRTLIKEIDGSSSLIKIKRGLRALEQFIEHENTAVENAIRLSAFVHARRAGMTEGQAARIAKELTVNFNRKGDYGQVMNALYLFYNASIQGSARIIEAAAKSRKVRVLIGATVVAAMFLDMLNRSLAGDDEDDKNRYDKIPDHVKERNLIIMLPEGRGDYIKIPLPWGYNVFHVLGQVMGEALTKPNFKASQGAARAASAVFGAFNPIGGEGSVAQAVSPTVTDPVVQWSENKDWAGRPLRPEGNPFDVEKPQSQQYWNSVREPSRWVTEKLNELTGGNEIRPGAVDVNPELIDLLIDTFTGGAGRFVSDTVSTPIKAIKGEDVESYEVPLLRKVYGRPGLGTLYEEYYRNADAIRVTEKEARHYIEVGDRDALYELQRDRPGEYSLIDERRRIDNALGKLRKHRNRIEASSLSETEKRAQLDEVGKKIEELMNRFNRLYNQQVE